MSFLWSKRHIEATKDGTDLRVMSFNVLAHGLKEGFVKCPKECLTLDSRLPRVAEEIIHYQPDIVGLQEVDFFSQLENLLTPHGYTGVWFNKDPSPCLHSEDNIGPDGTAVFYKQSKLNCIKTDKMKLVADDKPCSQIMLRMLFSLTSLSEIIIDLTCLHLKAKPEGRELRTKQGTFVLKQIGEQTTPNITTLIIGDLNSEPDEPVHQQILQSGFISSYTKITGTEPLFTTCKIRERQGKQYEQCKTEDYIYYRGSALQPSAVLLMPNKEDLGEGQLPSKDYPSDHLSMVTDFNVK